MHSSFRALSKEHGIMQGYSAWTQGKLDWSAIQIVWRDS